MSLTRLEVVFERGSRAINEDQVLVLPDIFGVFDGATSLTGYKDAFGRSGAYLASRIVCDTFAKDIGDDLPSVALRGNSKLLKEMEPAGIDTSRKVNLWSTTAAVVRVVDDQLQWIQISDSLIMVIRDDGSYQLLAEEFDHDAETLWIKKTQGQAAADADELRVANLANVDYGFLNGEAAASRFLNYGVLELKGIRNVLLFTDGLFIPKEDPRGKEDWPLFVELFQSDGLKNILGYVRLHQALDSDMTRYPRFKVHDDVAAIALTFSE